MKKSKFSDCEKCPLFNSPIVVGETNSGEDLSKVRVLFLAEGPAKEEVKQKLPLKGRAGIIFREVFKESRLFEIPHFITNVCLCSNIINGKPVTPPLEAIKLCKDNWRELIKITRPEVIVVFGGTAMNALEVNLKGEGIAKFRERNPHKFVMGDFECDLFGIYHPQFLGYNGGLEGTYGPPFISDMDRVYKFLNPDKKKQKKSKLGLSLKEPYMFKFPDWCFSKEFKLMDIQHNRKTGEILHIFRNINGERKYFTAKDSEYYYYLRGEKLEDAPYLSKISDVYLFLERPQGWSEEARYESDVRSELKRSIDYYIQRKIDEPDIHPKIMYFDIEIFNFGSREFPSPKKAKNPINAISYKIDDGPVKVLIGDSVHIDKKKIDDPDMIMCSSETDLLKRFCKVIRDEEPELITGWNSNDFDFRYIYNRMRKQALDPNLLSPLNNTDINISRYREIFISGTYALDMMELYKSFTYQGEESYSLGFIANKNLGKGKIKIEFVTELDDLYQKNLRKFIEYSKRDCQLLYDINKKMGHIELREEIRRFCSSTWRATETTMGQIDPLCIAFAKRKGLVCKNSECRRTDELIPGAYVRNPISGLHSYVVDFDFTSLYPSIIRSMNIGPNTYIGKISEEDAYTYIYYKDKLKSKIELTTNVMMGNPKKIMIKRDKFLSWLEENEAIVTIAGTIFKGHNIERSFLNEILEFLTLRRKKYKDLMLKAKSQKDESSSKLFENRETAHKILANALYGVLANYAFRFFKLDLAKSITLTGQEVIKFAGFHCSQYLQNENTEIDKTFMNNYDKKQIPRLIYTDTDSIFISMGDWLYETGKLNL